MLQSFGKDAVGKNVKIKSINLLGSSEKVRWKRSDDGLEIKPPSKKIFPDDKWPIVFKLTVQ